jgi:excisionase family DNA binding protein
MCLKELTVADVAHVTRWTTREGSRMGEPQPFATGGLLTVSEVAAAMRVSNMTVYRLIKNGELAAVRVGKNYRIRETDVERYLSDRSVQVEEN